MQAKEYPFSRIKRQVIYKIPFFQRTYVWQLGNWEDLWKELSSPKRSCFLGSIILKDVEDPLRERMYQQVVDGQQRLTTLTILLRALIDHFGDKATEEEYEEYLYFVRTKLTSGGRVKERSYKIEHSKVDAPFYKDIIDGKYAGIELGDEVVPENRLVYCYKFFREMFAMATDEELQSVTEKLTYDDREVLVFIELREDENEQVIFDAINSTGVKLTTSDIIKNELFQRVIDTNKGGSGEAWAKAHAGALYDETWFETFERDSDTLNTWLDTVGVGHNVRSNIDLFFSAFAQIKQIFNPAKDKVAELAPCYSRHVSGMDAAEIEAFIREICDYAETYRETFIGFDEITAFSFEDSTTRLLKMLKVMRLATFDAFILKTMKTLPEDEQAAVFNLLERYLMRNYVIGNSTRNYNTQAYEMIEGKFDFEEALSKPEVADDRLLASLRNIYSTRAGLVLFWIELHRHMDPESDLHGAELKYSFELEHIMPQKWRQHWGLDVLLCIDEHGVELSGNDAENARTAAVYEIGNMTLLPSRLNKDLKNYAFADKVNGCQLRKRWQKGMKDQTAFMITKEVTDRDPLVWREADIRARTQALFKEFCEIWPSSSK